MPHGLRFGLTILTGVALAGFAFGQSVISTRSGVVHYFDGDVYIENQQLQAHLGKFPTIPAGAELRTEQGRAEILLTPGVFLRLGEKSAIRLISNSLKDTQIELESGSAIVDADDPNPATSVTLRVKGWQLQFPHSSVTRINCDPPRLWVLSGEAEANAAGEKPVAVSEGNDLPLASVLLAQKTTDAPADSLTAWQKGRGESIVADNSIAAQIDQGPASATGLDPNFTYFPMIGVPPYAGLVAVSPSFSSVIPVQPGFNSIYIPGYTYAPMILTYGSMSYGMQRGPVGFRGIVTSTPQPIGLRPPGGMPSTLRPGVMGGGVSRPSGVVAIPRPATVVRPATPHAVGAAHR